MSAQDTVRANEFDQLVGEIQTKKAIGFGVGRSILDVGCGIAQFTPMFLERFSDVWGLDPSAEFLKIAKKKNPKIHFEEDFGESFMLDRKFDTISMNNLLEHVDDPIEVLKNCKRHLNQSGRIIAQVPNSESIARRLGVLMDIIPSTNDISERELNYYGHKRVYTLDSLVAGAEKAGLKVIESGGILYKPLPNDLLWKLVVSEGEEWTRKILKALVEFGKDRPRECAQLYIVCE